MNKIVHIANPLAGIGVYLNILFRQTNDKNMEHILIGNEQAILLQDKAKRPIKTYQLNLVRAINPIKDIIGLRKLLKLLREIKPDLIHCHSAKAGILGRIAGYYLKIPTLYTPHAYSYLSGEHGVKRFIYKMMERIVNKLPAKILACSISEYKNAQDELGIKKSKLLLWKNSIPDPQQINLTPSAIELPEQFICSIGRPSYQKNLEMLIDAYAQLVETIPNLSLVIIGIGEDSIYSQRIKEKIESYNLANQIILVPWLERVQMLYVLKHSLLYVSTSRYEGLSYSIIEALAFEKPCIVTDVDGNRDLIQDGYNGYLIKLNDIETLCQRIMVLFSEKELYHDMSNNARNTFLQNYDVVKNIDKIEKIYNNEITLN